MAMGATAAHSVLGKPTPIQKNRGQLVRVSDETQVLVTVHPSYLLRVPEERQAEEYRKFVEDLRKTLPPPCSPYPFKFLPLPVLAAYVNCS